MKRYLLLFGLLAMVMSGCRFFVPDDGERVSFIPRFEAVESIYIRDYWIGLSPTAPHIAEVTLFPTDVGFTGDITFSAGDIQKTQNVDIRYADMDAFLQSLGESEFTAGDYVPKIEWTDDYPTITIEIRTTDGDIQIYSSSQGDGHVPWGMMMDGTEYVINSDQPAQALDLIRADLHFDVFEALIEEARQR